MSKLEEMLKYVSEHNEFYKNRIKEYGIKDPLDITQWPILTRKELQENRYNMFSDGYKSKYFNQQLRRQSSSGSSGVPVNVYWDYKDWYASNMSLWRKRLQWYGIHPSDKYVMFTLNAFNIKNDGKTVYYINNPANILSVNVSLIQNESGYEKLVDIINNFEPKWFYIQPFVLNRLIQAYKRTGKIPPKTLKYIESIGELLASDLRRRAVEFFNVPLANMYGSEEMNGIALESPEHHMHVLSDNALIEIKNDSSFVSSGKGETIITNLNNFAMPLIRYCQGDQISCASLPNYFSSRDNCMKIDSINGRTYESIILSDGSEINSFMLMESISEINNRFSDIIIEYRFEYIKLQKLIICMICLEKNNKNWFYSVKEELANALTNKYVPNKELSIKIIDHEFEHESNIKKQFLLIKE